MIPLILALCAFAATEPRALDTKSIPLWKAQPHFDFTLAGRDIRVGHGAWKIKEDTPGWNKMYGYGPVVWVMEKKRSGSSAATKIQTRVLDLRAAFPSFVASHVYYDTAFGKRIYVFLEYGIEGGDREYVTWISEDAGEHWFEGGKLPRPPVGEFPVASLDAFHVDGAGHGVATLSLEASNLSPARLGSLDPHVDAYFRVTTDDGGRTWKPENNPAFSSVLRAARETTK